MEAPTAKKWIRYSLKSDLFCRICVLLIVSYSYAFTDEISDVLLCRNCGHDLGHGEDLLRIPTPLAVRQRNDTLLGKSDVLIQLLKNPEGNNFEVVTLKKADTFNMEEAHPEHSWFTGFAWQISLCPKCGTHIGCCTRDLEDRNKLVGWTQPHKTVSVSQHVDVYERFFTPNDKQSVEKRSFFGLILDKLLHQGYADSLLVVPKSYKS